MKKKIVSITAVTLVLMLALVGSASAQSESKIQFLYNGEAGLAFVTQTLDSKPSKACRMTVAGSIYYEGDSTTQAVKTLTTKSIKKNTSVHMVVSGLPSVALSSTSQRPILTLQTSTKCGSSTVVSNAVARYLLCGKSKSDVSPAAFLSRMRSKLKKASVER